jgi:hypothetical protein
MQVVVCRLYESYPDAHRVMLALESAGVSPTDTALISNNSDGWYRPIKTTSLPVPRQNAAGGKVEAAGVGVAIGATAATAASLFTMLAIPGVGAVVGAGWLAAMLGSMVAGGLLGALTNSGVSEDDAQVFVEGVRRGGTLVAARVEEAEAPRMVAEMNRSAVDLEGRRDLYRKSGWQSFDPNCVPYTADQVRCERVLHAGR